MGFFLIPFFHKKLRLYQGESQSFLICLLWFDFFFLVFQLTLQVQSLNHYVPNIDVYHTYSIYIVACLVCYYRALPIFFLIHLKRWLNNENLILPNKICKNFLISNASLILALDHQKQRVIREYYYIYGPWSCKHDHFDMMAHKNIHIYVPDRNKRVSEKNTYIVSNQMHVCNCNVSNDLGQWMNDSFPSRAFMHYSSAVVSM